MASGLSSLEDAGRDILSLIKDIDFRQEGK
jgi:hypothetical protein